MYNYKPKIIVLGGLNIDLVMNVPRIPVAGETVKGVGFSETSGGKGGNQAVACARLGGNVVMMGKLGNDAFYDVLINNLENANIDTGCVGKANTNTGVALIMVDEKGNNIISFSPGANGRLSMDDIDKYSCCFKDADAFLVQNECNIETVEYSIKIAFESSVPVIYNPAPALDITEETYKRCNVIIPNETEAELLTKIKIGDKESMKNSSDWFFDKGVKNVIITLGSRGAYYRTEDNREGIIAAPIVEAVDTVAAGDVFLGAFTVNYSKGNSIEQAVNIANHAAVLSVTQRGAQNSIPDIKTLYNEYPLLNDFVSLRNDEIL